MKNEVALDKVLMKVHTHKKPNEELIKKHEGQCDKDRITKRNHELSPIIKIRTRKDTLVT